MGNVRALKSMSYNAPLVENQVRKSAARPVASEERDSFSVGRLISGLAGARSSSAPTEAPVKMAQQVPASHGAKNGKTFGDRAGYLPKGEFKSDNSEVVAVDERSERENIGADKLAMQIDGPDVAPAGKPKMQMEPSSLDDSDGASPMLLLVLIPAALAGLVLWRFSARRRRIGDDKTN